MKKRILVSLSALVLASNAFAKVVCSATCSVGEYRSAVDYSVIGTGSDYEIALKNLAQNCNSKRVHANDPTVLSTSVGKRSSWDYSREMSFDIKKACVETN